MAAERGGERSPARPVYDVPRDPLLAGVSLAQLGCGLAGLVLALRRRHAYDIPFLHGSAERVGRDAMLMGTALSAPGPLLAAQAVLTVVLARRPRRWAARGLQVLGVLMVSGYTAERLVRHRLRPTGWQPAESAVAVSGLVLAAAMALVPVVRPKPGRAR